MDQIRTIIGRVLSLVDLAGRERNAEPSDKRACFADSPGPLSSTVVHPHVKAEHVDGCLGKSLPFAEAFVSMFGLLQESFFKYLV